jgi:hypothetical protein
MSIVKVADDFVFVCRDEIVEDDGIDKLEQWRV